MAYKLKFSVPKWKFCVKMKIIIPKGMHFVKIYQNLVQNDHTGPTLDFGLSRVKISKFQYQNETFCTKNENLNT